MSMGPVTEGIQESCSQATASAILPCAARSRFRDNDIKALVRAGGRQEDSQHDARARQCQDGLGVEVGSVFAAVDVG
jgi:hypothetical protein